jgi:lysophospholipase L1-like esterase
MTMPKEWALREVHIPGAAKAYYWQGALHVEDENGFRRSTPFPQKDPNTFRVMVVGDSLTFGLGLEQNDTFVALLNSWMAKDYRIEFLNLGVVRYQSEDVLRTIRTFLPRLRPDLVLYAVCLNDFAPSGKGEYHDDDLYQFPLPGRIKRFLIAHTRAGAFLNDKYDAALRKVHLRRDFYDDILIGFGGYEARFRRDVAEMNRIVTTAGLPPMTAIVVDQNPEFQGRGYTIARVAEDALTKAGADVIATEDYYRRYNNQSMYVSNWEGHPNEVANYIWAEMISQRLTQRPDLMRFRR